MKIELNVGEEFPEITGENADRFAKELLKIEDSDYQEVILDFTQTNSISSMAMGSLFATYQKMMSENRKIKIVNPNENVERLLKMVNLGDLLDSTEK